MQRRTFAKALSSLLLVPLLRYQPVEIDRHKLLGMFLDELHWDTRLWDLRRPYIVGQHAYATNSKILARIDTDESEHDDESIKVPPVGDVWREYNTPGEKWKPFRLADIDELAPSTDIDLCPLCDNRRVSFGETLPATFSEVRGLDYDPDDNTVRDQSCSLCNGKPYTKHCFQAVSGLHINYQYAKKLAAIPGCEVAFSANLHQVGGTWSPRETPVLLFRSDIGIGGMVCPITEPI